MCIRDRLEQSGNDKEKRQAIAAQVGATPLSSSSLNNYYADANESLDMPSTPEAAGASSSDHLHQQQAPTTSSAGIMNFIFRNPDANKPAEQPKKRDSGPPAVVHLPQVPENVHTDATDREKVEMQVIKSLVESYFVIVRKNFIDLTPKIIMYMLVNHTRETLQNELVSELYRDAEMGQLLQEAEDIAVRRQTCNEMKDLLGRALEIVNEVRDFNSFS